MAERAHPNDPVFQSGWRFRWRKGIIPTLQYRRSPFLAAFIWRYHWVQPFVVGKDVIDVPCGMGWGTSLLKNTRSLVGVDLCTEAVAEANSRYGAHADFCVGSMDRLSFDNDSKDVICCLEGIEHVPVEVAQAFIREAARVLRCRGRLLLSSPYCSGGEHSGNPFHVHEYQPDEIVAMISSLFRIEDMVEREVGNLKVNYIRAVRREGGAA